MRGEFIDLGGRRLYYYAAGSRGAGEPIVLIHGFPTSSHLWSELVPLLPEGHRVVVVDLLGYGRSDPPGSADLSLHAHGSRLVALMDALGIARATLVGHHLGGGVAQAVATSHPERVCGLALLHSIGVDAVLAGRLAAARAFLGLVRWIPVGAALPLLHRELSAWYNDGYRGGHSVDQYLRPFHGAGYRSLLRHFAALEPAETQVIAARLSSVAVPSTVIAGRRDVALPASVAERLHAAIPHSTLDFIQDARHFSPEEAPRRVAESLATLLRR